MARIQYLINVSGSFYKFLAYFDPLPPLPWHFLPYKCWQKVDIFELPTLLFLSQRSSWMASKVASKY